MRGPLDWPDCLIWEKPGFWRLCDWFWIGEWNGGKTEKGVKLKYFWVEIQFSNHWQLPAVLGPGLAGERGWAVVPEEGNSLLGNFDVRQFHKQAVALQRSVANRGAGLFVRLVEVGGGGPCETGGLQRWQPVHEWLDFKTGSADLKQVKISN